MDNFYRPKTGCKDQIINCQALADKYDPDAYGNNDHVNEVCQNATDYCGNEVEGLYIQYSGRNYYDISVIDPDPFPYPYFEGFLSQHWVQGALGVPINFTVSNNAVYAAFDATGDYARKDIRGGQLADLAYLLDKGVKVALMFGDRDYACNCKLSLLPVSPLIPNRRSTHSPGIGGERASLAVNYSQSTAFRSAGYADIQVNSSYVGGQVRQHGNYSFSRVYQAGHEVPSYQPEAAYQIFQRAIFGLDIATGTINTEKDSEYSSQGDVSASQTLQEAPESPEPTCYILDLYSCTDDQYDAVLNNTALIHDFILIDENTQGLFPGIGNGTITSGNDSGAYTPGRVHIAGGFFGHDGNMPSPSETTSAPPSYSTSTATSIGVSIGLLVAGFAASGFGLGLLAL